jgi:hypothetical protein
MAGWQLDCCGEPFRVRSRVSWGLRPNTSEGWLDSVLGPEVVTIDAVEDHHCDNPQPTNGTVTAITALYCRFTPEPVPGSGLLVEVYAAEKWTGDRDGRRFAGFLVRLCTHDEAGGDAAVRAGLPGTPGWSNASPSPNCALCSPTPQ